MHEKRYTPEAEMTDVIALTYPDKLRRIFETGNSLPYQRIAELYLRDGSSGQSVILLPDTQAEATARKLSLPISMAERLMDVAKEMRDYGYYNCHRFSRAMKDPMLAQGYKGREPITHYFHDRPKLDNIPVGAIGLIGVSGYGVPHSLVGLGADIPESLQVMSAGGELGIAANLDVLAWYRWINDGEDVHLYQAPETLAFPLRR